MTETLIDRLNTDEQKDLISDAEIKRIQEFLTKPEDVKQLADELKSLRDQPEMKQLMQSFEQSLTQHTAERLADSMRVSPDHLQLSSDLQNLILFNTVFNPSLQGKPIDFDALQDPKQRNIIIAGLTKELILSSPALQQSLQQARLEQQRQQLLQQLDKDFHASLSPDRLLALNGIDLTQRPRKLPASLDEIATITPENVGTYLNLGPKVEDPTTATNAVKQFLASYLQEFPNYQSDLLDTPGATVTGMNLQNMAQRLSYSRQTRELYIQTKNKSDTIFKTGQLPPELQNAYLGPDALKVMIKEHLISLATPDKQSDFQVRLYEQTRAGTPLGVMLQQINTGSKATNSAPFLKQLIQAGYDTKVVRVVGASLEKLQQQLDGKSKIQQIGILEAMRTGSQSDIYRHPALKAYREYNADMGRNIAETNKQYKQFDLQVPTALDAEKVFDNFSKQYGEFSKRMRSLEPALKAAQAFLDPTVKQQVDNGKSNGQAEYYGKIAFEKKYGMTVDQLVEQVKNAQMKITEVYIKTLLGIKPQPDFVTKGQKIQSPFMPGMMLDFSQKTPDAIIRNTFLEQGADGWNQFVSDIKNNPARAFANIMACIASVAVMVVTKNPIVSASASTLAFRAANGITQGLIQGIYHGDFNKGLEAFHVGVGTGSVDAEGKFAYLGAGEVMVDLGADTLETYLGGKFAKMINAKVLGNGSGKTILSKVGHASSERALNDVVGEIGIAQTITNPSGAFFKNLLGVENSVANGLTSRWGRNYSKAEGGNGSLASAFQAASESFGRDLGNPAMLVQMMGHSLLFSGVVSSARAGGDVSFKYLPAKVQQNLSTRAANIQDTVQRIEQKLVNNAITIRIENGIAALQSKLGKRYASVDALIQDHPGMADIKTDIADLNGAQHELKIAVQESSKAIAPDTIQGKIVRTAQDLGLSGTDIPLHIEASAKAALLKKQGKPEEAKKYEDAAKELQHMDQRIKSGMDQPIQTLETAGIQRVESVDPAGMRSTGIDLSKNPLRTATQQTVDIKTQTETTAKTEEHTETKQTKEKSEQELKQQQMMKSLGIDVQMNTITTREQASKLETKLNAIISNKLLSPDAKLLAQQQLTTLQAHIQTLPATSAVEQNPSDTKVIPLKPQSTPSQQTGTDG